MLRRTKGHAPSLSRIRSKLKASLPQIRRDYHIRSLGIFGSYVKGAMTKNSDLDLLVEFTDTPTLFEFMRLRRRLSEVSGVTVDLVMKKALKPNIGRRILDEVVSL